MWSSISAKEVWLLGVPPLGCSLVSGGLILVHLVQMAASTRACTYVFSPRLT
jgi:hypothetical protein